MARYYRNLQIKSISAKGLERVNLSGNKMEAYAYVLISGSGKQRTVVDRVGDTNPTWNGTMNFMVEEESAEDQILMFELCCCEPNGGDKDIGEVFVNVKDLMGPIEGSLTYHVLRTPPGNPKGKLNFMYEWGDQVAGAVLTPPTPPTPPPPPAFTAYNPPPPPYAAAAAATGQYLPYPPPAPVMLMGPLPPGSYGYPLPPQPGYGYWYGYGYGYGYGPQIERANNSGSIGGWLGRVIAGAAITEILNNISLP